VLTKTLDPTVRMLGKMKLKYLTVADVSRISLLAGAAAEPLPDARLEHATHPCPERAYDKGPARAALREAIQALGNDARMELMALMWIGRGDFGGTFEDALKHAWRNSNETDAAYIAEKAPVLPAYLRDGLRYRVATELGSDRKAFPRAWRKKVTRD
jgi:hypothetical protein